jgi:hypothetical protein
MKINIPVPNLKDTPFGGVKFTLCNVTPELAAAWLKHNVKNRRIKKNTVEAYAMDIRNGAWLTTHQGIAFDADENLIDGQHRLHGIVEAKKSVLIFVSTGWPLTVNGKLKTMDTVDRGVNRSLADQLHLQHGLDPRSAARVVQICNSIAAICFGYGRVRKSTTESILAVFAIYKSEIQWLLDNPVQQHGIKQSLVMACLVFARALWPEKTNDFLQRLMTGENLTKENPILVLRNWLLGKAGHEERSMIPKVVFHHLICFVDGKPCQTLVTHSDVAYLRVLKNSAAPVKKICAIYNQISLEFMEQKNTTQAQNKVEEQNGNSHLKPNSSEAIAIGQKIVGAFTMNDLIARLDGGSAQAGHLLAVWKASGWIETCGFGQYRRTEKFGK